MKKLLALLMAIVMVLGLVACGNSPAQNKEPSDTASGGSLSKLGKVDPTDPSIYTLDCMTSMGIWETPKSAKESDKAAGEMLKKIEANPDTLKPKSGGKYIYVANNGSDAKGHGYTEDKPVATIGYANLLAKAGDVVVLKRGNFWREYIEGKEGVSYGAYGKGNKPTIYGSPENLANREWKLSDTPDVYTAQIGATSNVGAIVFDHGVAVGSLKKKPEDVKVNYDYYIKGGRAYVYCTDGNPGELYANIETCSGGHLLRMKSNSTAQNLRLMYTGIHGISMGTVENVEVDGCVVGYVGGGSSVGNARLGNGIEVYGGCKGYTIRNCHVFQCYDAGVTFQYDGAIVEEDILFENNLLEYSVYNIEYFMGREAGIMKDVFIQGNILRYGGYGWGYHTRPDKNRGTNYQGRGLQNQTANFVVKNNIFDHSMSFLAEFSANKEKPEWLPTFTGNTYYQEEDNRIARVNDKNYGVKRYGEQGIIDAFGDTTGKLHIYK